jgi:anti-sigma factor RsiW
LNQALKALHADRARIEKQIDAVTSAISSLGGAAVRAAKTAGRRGRRKMNAAQKKAVSLRMKAYWAKRRGSK